MANVSDIIEQFILQTLGEDSEIELSRNELASFFAVAPSQINYVLETRFSIDKGYMKESRRGGGGSIKLIKIPLQSDSYINDLVFESIGDELTYKRALQILSRLYDEEILTSKEVGIIKTAICDESLVLPILLKDKLRATIFKNVLLFLLKEKNNG